MTTVNRLDWSDQRVNGHLPAGTVTLLLADVQGSTRLWQARPDEMTAAVAQLDRILADLVRAHRGVRPVEQGEGDSFVVAFGRASDAVACALALQRAPLSPILLRIGVHTGEVQLRDENNYMGPTINRTARLRDLAHGGQTVLSGTAADVVIDMLPIGAWLTDLGTQPLRDLPRPERVVQLCHPDLHNEFPPLRTSNVGVSQHLPAQLTSFVGRDAQVTEVRGLLSENRLLTLTGAGGIGKTRMAVHVATQAAAQFSAGVYVDLAPIIDPGLVAVTAARALRVPDQPGRSTTATLLRFIGDQHMLMVLDNCEHLLDASAALTTALLRACPRLTVLATSREPIGVPGEVTWRVPPLSLADDAVAVVHRPRPPCSARTSPSPATTPPPWPRSAGGWTACRWRSSWRRRGCGPCRRPRCSTGSDDRFRLLTGGARTALPRQQTLRAAVDWSHALLTDAGAALCPPAVGLHRGLDLEAAEAVAGADGVAAHEVLDLLTRLVDKSLVVAENTGGRARYRLLETLRQYALEKLGQSGEADAIRDRHRDHYTAKAAVLDEPTVHQQRIEQIDTDIDNLRAAFAWSRAHAVAENIAPRVVAVRARAIADTAKLTSLSDRRGKAGVDQNPRCRFGAHRQRSRTSVRRYPETSVQC